MPIIRCNCGAEILLVPDINAMNRAIENHIDIHKILTQNTNQQNDTPKQVIQNLVEQVLQKASEE
jgi:hypothetical protein